MKSSKEIEPFVKNKDIVPHVKSNYFELHLKILLYLGIDIMEIKNVFFRTVYYTYAAVFIGITIYAFIITEAMDLILNFTDLRKMTFGLSYMVTHILGMAKVTILVIKRKSLWRIFQKLEEGIFKPNFDRGGEQEYKFVNSAIKLTNNQGSFFYTFVFLIIGLRGIYAGTSPGVNVDIFDELSNTSTVQHRTTMPFTTWFPFNINVRPYYELGFFYQMFCTIIYGIYIGAADAVICGCMMHIKAQFLILKQSLDTVIERAIKNVSPENDENTIYDSTYNKVRLRKGITMEKRFSERVQLEVEKLVVQSVHHHQQLITLCDEVENEITYLMLLQFLSSLIILCFQLFQLSLTTPASPEFASMCLYLLLMMFQILCYCWHGNEVILISGNVPNFVYNIEWILLNNSTKKALLLMMMRAQRTMKFTAGKFTLLSLQTYMTIVRGSCSYFMVLRQMNN